ncbi:MAG: adenylate/guanylate cyclase domain-containing protein [Planctomycetota bacterium]
MPAGRAMEFRIGVHLGEVRVEGERIYGDGVNVAARLERLAEPGGTCISDDVLHQVQRKLQLDFDDLGEQAVKNIPDPVHAYRLRERAAEAPAQRERGSPRTIVLSVAAAFAVVAIAVAVYLTMAGRSPAPAGAPLTAIAVLPFDDMSPGGDQAWLAKIFAQELTDKLTRSEALQVVASTVAHNARQKAPDIRGVGELLDVGSVVEGQVWRSGGDLRITAQLIRVTDGYQIWAASYERKAEEVIAIQEEIAEALRAKLGVGEDTYSWLRRARYKPADPRAFDLVKKGVELEQELTEAGFRGEIDYALRALEIDPNYAQAHAQLAWAHYFLWMFRFDRSDENLAKARASAGRALANDEANGSAHLLMAFFSMDERDWQGAEGRLLRAIDLNPGQGSLRWGYGNLLMRTGRVQEGLVQQRLFAQLNPGIPVPDLGALATAYHLSGNEDAALEALLHDAPEEMRALARSGYEQAGWKGGIESSRQWLTSRSGRACTDDPTVGVHLFAWLGEADALFDCLDEVIEEKSWLFYKADPLFAPYRDDPRFTAVLRRMGLEE